MSKTEVVYIAYFRLYDSDHLYAWKRHHTKIPGIRVAEEGFWLNENHEYEPADKPLVWIPPSQMLYVLREERPVHQVDDY
jgi:hypothetical protein